VRERADTLLLEITAWVDWIAGRFDSSADSWLQSAALNRGALSGRRGWGVPPAVVSLTELGRLPEARSYLTEAATRGQWNFGLHAKRTGIRCGLPSRGLEIRTSASAPGTEPCQLEGPSLYLSSVPGR
jgi:hypothetical protein